MNFNRSKAMNNLSKAGFALAISSMIYLTGLLLSANAPLNLASWVLWFTIDFALMASLAKAGKPYALMVAFTLGTAVITAIATYNFMTGKTSFTWGTAEWMTVATVGVALIAWKVTNNDVGVIVTTLAMVVAGIPTWVDAYHAPQEQSILFWSMSGGACLLTYFGSPKTFLARFMPASGVGANGIILLLSLRQFL